MKAAEQLVAFGQGNAEALAQSGQVVATGMQDLGKLMAASAQGSMDEAASTFRALATVRSFEEAMDLQAVLARTAVERALTQAGQVAEASLKVAEQAMAPIASRMGLAAQSFSATA